MRSRARRHTVGKDMPARKDALREPYFLAAYQVLAESGRSGLTVAAICDRAAISRGSFYHHFGDLPGFVAAFARRWQAWIEQILDGYLVEADPRRRLELACNSHIATMNGAEPAIRAWARTEPALAAAVEAIDRYGEHFGAATFAQIVGEERTGVVLRDMMTSILIGMQQRTEPVSPQLFISIEAEWVTRCLGVQIELVQVEARPCLRVLPWTDPPSVLCAHEPAAVRAVSAAYATEPDRPTRPPAKPLKPSAWFAAGEQLLARTGPSGISIAAMCRELEVTKGSFHHHFEGLPDFHEKFTTDWVAARRMELEQLGKAEPLERLELMHRVLLAAPDPAASAWRTWTWTNPVVAAAVGQVDREREALLRSTLEELGESPMSATALATMGIALCIGMHQQSPRFDQDTATHTTIEWLERCLRLQVILPPTGDDRRLILQRPGAASATGTGPRTPALPR